MKKISGITGLMIVATAMATLSGCTTSAGPFVTNISSDGKGNIMVEKNTLVVNGFTGAITTGNNPTQTIIKVAQDPQTLSK
jgi:hypothetical protein